jgi:hypothetical protein
MKKLIVGMSTIVAVVLAVAIYTPITIKQTNVSRSRPGDFLGRYGDNPDNWQAQSQKKEGTFFCPPFCAPKEMATTGLQQKGRWHVE